MLALSRKKNEAIVIDNKEKDDGGCPFFVFYNKIHGNLYRIMI